MHTGGILVCPLASAYLSAFLGKENYHRIRSRGTMRALIKGTIRGTIRG